MRRYALLLLVLGMLLLPSHRASAGPGMPADLVQLLMGFSAKESCSCAFVVGQTDAYCTAFGQQPGFVVTLTFDHKAQTVTSDVGVGMTRTAHLTASGGCVLDGF